LFIALFDYDPFKMSPNTDSCQEELPFKEGEFIKVYGEQDADGYYYGESNGRTGYIPSNMVSEVRDQDVAAHYGSIESLTEQRSNKGGSRTSLQNVGKSSKTTKVSSSSSKSKEQSFIPINNYNNGNSNNGSQYGQQPQQQKANVNKMVALYDYDPQSLSPNVDVDVSETWLGCYLNLQCRKYAMG
jgi:RIMS-binding protein 2